MFKKHLTLILIVILIFNIVGIISVGAAEPCWVNASVLNCRLSPDINSPVIARFNRNTPLTIIGAEGKWWQIFTGTFTGWCYSDYLSLRDPNATTTNNATTVTIDNKTMKPLGSFKITYYTCSPAENGGWDVTALGHKLTSVVGTCIAVDPKVIPYGKTVYIEGIGYRTAMDCGGAIKGNKIDVLVRNHSDIPSYGVRQANVYLVD